MVRSSENFQGLDATQAKGVLSGLHLPALDGVRGIAILMVLFRHFFEGMEGSIVQGGTGASIDWFVYNITRLGSVGVDLFFVLSGFLITGILLDSKGKPNFFRRFYVRRSLRIFPLYYGFLAFVFFIWPLLEAPYNRPLKDAANYMAWYWTYTPNILFALHGKYHGLMYFWSLAVEEQFYLIWPVLIYLLSPKIIKRACIACIFIALALRIACAASGLSIVVPYVLMPTRVDTLAIGALIAIYMREPGGAAAIFPYCKWIVALTALALIVVLTATLGAGRTLWVNALGGTPVALLFGVVVFSAAALPPTAAASVVFRSPVLRFFGKYAYCLYVVHTFLQGILEHYVKDSTFVDPVMGSILPGRLIYVAICMLATIVVAFLSWHLFEKQFLKLKFLGDAPPSKRAVATYAATHPVPGLTNPLSPDSMLEVKMRPDVGVSEVAAAHATKPVNATRDS